MSLARLRALAVAELGPDDGPPGRPSASAEAGVGASPPVRVALAARAEVGALRYGGPLRYGWPWATVGAWQEALDAMVYLEADPGATSRELALARELAEVLTGRIVRTPAGTVLAPLEYRGE
ncbi:MAG: hypothetical protein ACO3CU_11745 [Candidatus Nanopelagicales bacterium]